MKTISMTQKKWLLLLHVIFSAICLEGQSFFWS